MVRGELDDHLHRATRRNRLARRAVAGQGEGLLAERVPCQGAQGRGPTGVAVRVGERVGEGAERLVEDEAVGRVELGPHRNVAIGDLPERDVSPPRGRPFALGGPPRVGTDDPAVDLTAHPGPRLLGQGDRAVPVDGQAGGEVKPGGIARLRDHGRLPGSHRAAAHGPPQRRVAVPQVEHGGDPVHCRAGGDAQQAGDLADHELADRGSAVAAARHPPLGAPEQRLLVDPMEIAECSDREAGGHLGRSDLRLRVIERGCGIRHRAQLDLHNVILLEDGRK